MDTAKVDIRKLQLLNDRINQCIDALNQVRLSVHGLSHTSAIGQGIPFGQAFGQSPYGVPLGGGFASPYGTAAASPFGQTNPFGQPLQTPLGVSGGVPYGIGGLGVNPAIGLSHTSAESAWADPYRAVSADPLLMVRIAQTFPYAYHPGAYPGISY